MDQFLGEIRLFAGNFEPKGWAFCNGQLLTVSRYTALFSLLGTQYGGDGKNNFALPNFQGRAPLHHGQGPGLSDYRVGEPAGTASVTLLTTQIPSHTHVPNSQSATNGVANPTGAVWTSSAGLSGQKVYGSTPDTPMSPMAIQPQGGTQPHNNRQPYLGLHFIIALEGIFPPRS